MPEHRVEIFAEVRDQDVKKLASSELEKVVARIVADLYSDPAIGEACDPEHRTIPLQDCFKVKFNERGYYKPNEQPPRNWRPGWRLVYHVEDGEVTVVAVVAIAERKNMAVYRITKQRLALRSGSPRPRQRG